MLYKFIDLTWYTVSLLPLKVLYLVSDVLALVAQYIVRYRRKVIRNNLRTSFPYKTLEELRGIERGFYCYFCDYIVETIKLRTLSESELRRRMTFEGVEQLNDLTSRGRSISVYLGHYGNWEWITSLPYHTNGTADCMQIYHPLQNTQMDTLFIRLRERQGAKCVSMQDTLRTLMLYRQKGRPFIVGCIADQVPLWWNIHHWLPFLNHDTPVLTGTEKLIHRLDQATFYGEITRPKRGYYHCKFVPIALDAKLLKENEITDIYFSLLEKTIEQRPELYLWSHNRWKRTHEEFDRLYEIKDGKTFLKS